MGWIYLLQIILRGIQELDAAAVIKPTSAGVVGDLQPQVAAPELYARAGRQALPP